MKYTKINIQNIIIHDPVMHKKTFMSTLGLNDDNDITFMTDTMKIVSVDGRKLILEFLPNYPQFFKFIYDVDMTILETIVDNGQKWFGKIPKYDTIDRLFQRSIIPQTSLLTYPTMQFVVPDGCVIRDINGDNIKLSELEENNEVSCVLTIKHIIFLENKFYLDFEINEINVENYVAQQTECMFSESCSSEMDG
jgi:hypothetical protein